MATEKKTTTKTEKKPQPKTDSPVAKAVKKPAAPKKITKKKAEPKTAAVKVEKKEPVKPAEVKEKVVKKTGGEYLYGVGRRKTGIAQVRVYKKGTGKVTVNEKDSLHYFPTAEQQERIMSPLKIVGQVGKLDVTVKVSGGGPIAQAGAIRHGISRALLQLNPNFKKPLKKAGYLTRDPRKKERKKPGLKRARKAPQWKKR